MIAYAPYSNDVREVSLICDIRYSTNLFDRARQTLQTLLRKHKLPGTNYPADHDRRHISTSGTAKNAVSSLRLEPMGNRVDRCRSVTRAIRDFTSETRTAGHKLSSRPRAAPRVLYNDVTHGPTGLFSHL